jgi:hypothetical protein
VGESVRGLGVSVRGWESLCEVGLFCEKLGESVIGWVSFLKVGG